MQTITTMENVCFINLDAQTINILNAFNGQTAVYSSSVVIILENVVNPAHNKEDLPGFSIFTYGDYDQKWRIDILPSDELKPSLKCDYPCRTCLESDRKHCTSCWTDDFSDVKYFYEGIHPTKLTQYGFCGTACPDGQSRNGNPDYVCRDCDKTCGRCLDSDIQYCIDCDKLYPFSVIGTGICLPDCTRGYYHASLEKKTCSTCDPLCKECEGNAKNCTRCFT